MINIFFFYVTKRNFDQTPSTIFFRGRTTSSSETITQIIIYDLLTTFSLLLSTVNVLKLIIWVNKTIIHMKKRAIIALDPTTPAASHYQSHFCLAHKPFTSASPVRSTKLSKREQSSFSHLGVETYLGSKMYTA